MSTKYYFFDRSIFFILVHIYPLYCMPDKPASRKIDFEKHSPPNIRSVGRNYLLVIGIDTYHSIRPLTNAVRDAKALTHILHLRYEFEPAYTIELYNEKATREEIFSAFDYLGSKITEADNLLIFYAGHGYYNHDLEIGYWIPVDGKDGRSGSFIEHSAIRTYLRSIDSHHSFLIVDSCFSGNLLANRGRGASLTEVYADRVDRFPSRWCFAAGMIEEVSDGYIGDHSPFAHSLIDFLEHNGEPRLPIQELIHEVSMATTYNAKQTPISGVIIDTGSHTGQFVFDLRVEFLPVTNTSEEKQTPELPTAILSPEPEYTEIIIGDSSFTEKLLQNKYIWLAAGVGIIALVLLFIFSPWNGAPANTQALMPLDTSQHTSTPIPEHMVFIQGGSFEMGDIFDEGEENEKPVHTVVVNSFLLGKYEVSFDEYEAYCSSMNIKLPYDAGWGRGLRPVIHVSWTDALKYCNWLSKQAGLDTVYTFGEQEITANWRSKGFRLPTEAEWEYAARERGNDVRFGNGRDTADAAVLNFYSKSSATESFSLPGLYRGKTIPVNDSSVIGNQLGLYHMSGNVWEWCWDGYAADFYEYSPKVNPIGVPSFERILRGGSWDDSPDLLRISNRDFLFSGGREKYIGFRVAKSP